MMKAQTISTLVTIAAAALAVTCLVRWHAVAPSLSIRARVATLSETNGQESMSAATDVAVDIAGAFQQYDGTPSDLPGAWPGFRGVNSDNISPETIPLADTWPEPGPPVLWSVELGEGHAGPAVLNGRVYLLDYDETEKADALRCFSLDDGREIWRRWYNVQVKRNHGMSRTVPAVTDEHVVTMGPKCHVMCVDAMTGTFRWGLDLGREFKTKVPLWYNGQCPIIDKSTAIIAPCGKMLMIAVDCKTGQLAWQLPNHDQWRLSHASIVPVTLGGRKMYVYCAVGGIVAVAADGDDVGTVLWKTAAWNHAVVVPSAVWLGDSRIFVTAGYGVGSMLLDIGRTPKSFSATPVYRLDRKIFASEQHTPVYYRNSLFAVLPNDAGLSNRQLACLDPAGGRVWTSGKSKQFGLGPFIVADDKIFILKDNGLLTLARATAKEYVELASAKVFDGHEAWAPMAIAGGRLLLRDRKRMLCLDVRKM